MTEPGRRRSSRAYRSLDASAAGPEAPFAPCTAGIDGGAWLGLGLGSAVGCALLALRGVYQLFLSAQPELIFEYRRRGLNRSDDER